MNLTTQLRIILLLTGAAIWLGIYLLGKRSMASRMSVDASADDSDATPTSNPAAFAPADELDDEELETPAYMRRQGQREVRQDYEPRIANVDDYDDSEALQAGSRRLVDIPVHDSHREVLADHADADLPRVSAEREWEAQYAELDTEPVLGARHEPRVTLDDSFAVSTVAEPHLSSVLSDSHASELDAPPVSIPVIAEPVVTSYQIPARSPEQHAVSAAPTLSDVVRKSEQPVTAPAPTQADARPSSGAAGRRKIIALRLPVPERVPGTQLLSLLQREQLQHGKFGIFHRMYEANSVFSVASMVEPGTFDPQTMAEQQFPGVTLFMLLPGPLDGLVAYDQMMSCAQRLAHATGGTLQDERGSKLTAQSMDRLRDEVLDFQHLIGGVATAH